MAFLDFLTPTLIQNVTYALFILIGFNYYNKIEKTIGLNGLSYYFKAFKGRDKGIILIRVYNEDLTTNYALGRKEAEKIILTNINGEEKQSAFILRSDCIYTNELGLKCIDYYASDIDPKDPKTGDIVTTSPIALQNIITNATKAEVLSNGAQDFFIKNFKIIGIGIIGLVAVLGFIILTQNGDISACYQSLNSIKVIAE
jgi:hypothetical protein